MPITFFVEISDPTKEGHLNQALAPFIQLYQLLEANKNGMLKLKE